MLFTTFLIGFFVSMATSSNVDNKLYSFAYHVIDPSAGQDFGHAEQGLKDAVTGEYKVLMPDDRIQVVTYTADSNGYVANVAYTDGSQSPAYGKQASNQPSTVTTFFSPPTASAYGANQYANLYGPVNQYGSGNPYGGAPYGSYGSQIYGNSGSYQSSNPSQSGSFLSNFASRMGAYVPGVGCTCP